MEKLKTNQRKIHRKITAISAIPLLITIVSGTIYSILQPLGVDAFWLINGIREILALLIRNLFTRYFSV